MILASNHLSYSDWLFMPLVIPRRVTFVAKAEYFEGSGIKGLAPEDVLLRCGPGAIDCTSGSAAAGAIKTRLRLLSEGEVCGIYPEGTRSHDGKLYRGRTGVARLALEAGVPPSFHHPGGPLLSVLRPASAWPSILFACSSSPFHQSAAMYEVMRLSGQEYVDLYAQDAKKRDREIEREAAKVAAKAEADEVWDTIKPE